MREREQGVLVASPGGLFDLKRQAGGGVGGELLLCHAPARGEDRKKRKKYLQKAPLASGFSGNFENCTSFARFCDTNKFKWL
jgi:hypothetical protein